MNRKMGKTKKLLSLILAVIMLLSAMSLTIIGFAATEGNSGATEGNSGNDYWCWYIKTDTDTYYTNNNPFAFYNGTGNVWISFEGFVPFVDYNCCYSDDGNTVIDELPIIDVGNIVISDGSTLVITNNSSCPERSFILTNSKSDNMFTVETGGTLIIGENVNIENNNLDSYVISLEGDNATCYVASKLQSIGAATIVSSGLSVYNRVGIDNSLISDGKITVNDYYKLKILKTSGITVKNPTKALFCDKDYRYSFGKSYYFPANLDCSIPFGDSYRVLRVDNIELEELYSKQYTVNFDGYETHTLEIVGQRTFGQINDGVLTKFKGPLRTEDSDIFTNDPVLLLQYGWKQINKAYVPDDLEMCETYQLRYSEDETTITEHYDIVENHINNCIYTEYIAPTCTTDGKNICKYACAFCGKTSFVEITEEKLGHKITTYEAKSATCTEIGWEAYESCSRCDYTTYVEIAAKGHDLVDHEAKAATCTEIGWNAYQTCKNCDYSTYVEIAAKGHDLVDHEAKAATCTEIGWDAYQTCKNCDYSTYAEIKATGHDLVDHEVKAATCTEIGWNAYQTCKNCDYTTYSEIPAKGHEYVDHEAQAATCTEIGWAAYKTCKNCDYTTYAEISANHEIIHHDAKAATCSSVGWEAYDSCANCDYTTYVEIPMTKHSLVVNMAKKATCTESGWSTYRTCKNCDYSTFTEIPALGHDIEKHAAKAPTCKEIGWTEYETCSRCSYSTYSEIPVIDHTKSDWIVQDAPTCTDKGYRVKACTMCGTVLVADEISALGHKDADSNGYCDTCGESVTNNCSHMCHKGGFSGFIWKIVNLFNKLFKINQYCSCGARHW